MRPRLLKALAAIAVIAGVVGMVIRPKPILVWNVTASAPLGLYRFSGERVGRGSWVLISPPHDARELAAIRHYLPRNVPMVKRVAAVGGDLVCRTGQQVSVNGEPRAVAFLKDNQGRKLPQWQGCNRLSSAQIFILTAPAASFDSRYFGAVSTDNLIERIEPVWTY